MSDRKKKWSDLTQGQQAMVVVGGAIEAGLTTATLISLGRRPADRVNGPKFMWRLLAFLNIVGPTAYFIFGRRR